MAQLEDKTILTLVLSLLSPTEQHRYLQVCRLWNYVLRTYVIHKVVCTSTDHPLHERALGFSSLTSLELRGYPRSTIMLVVSERAFRNLNTLSVRDVSDRHQMLAGDCVKVMDALRALRRLRHWPHPVLTSSYLSALAEFWPRVDYSQSLGDWRAVDAPTQLQGVLTLEMSSLSIQHSSMDMLTAVTDLAWLQRLHISFLRCHHDIQHGVHNKLLLTSVARHKHNSSVFTSASSGAIMTYNTASITTSCY
jgi:hypothetical protein